MSDHPMADFLLARIAEDEARVLAECEAKRRIVNDFSWVEHPKVIDSPGGWGGSELFVLQVMAAVHADHPDFDPSWEPET